MITVNVKTLNGATCQCEVSGNLTISQFKEHIAPMVFVAAANQRLIYRGRVLQDQQILNALDLDGKTLHLVERGPNQTGELGNNTTLPNRRPIPRVISSQHVVIVNVPELNAPLTGSINRVLNRLGDVGRRALLSVNQTPADNRFELTLIIRDDSPTETENPAFARLRDIRHVIGHVNHVIDQMENDRLFSDESSASENQPSTTSNDVTPKPSASNSRTAESGNLAQSGDLDGVEAAQGGPAQNQSNEDLASFYATVFDEFQSLEQRLQPHMQRYLRFSANEFDFDQNASDGQRAARFLLNMQILLQTVSRIYHSFGDLNLNFRRVPQRISDSLANSGGGGTSRVQEPENSQSPQSRGPENVGDSGLADLNEFEATMENLLRSALDNMRVNRSAPASTNTVEVPITTSPTISQSANVGPIFVGTPPSGAGATASSSPAGPRHMMYVVSTAVSTGTTISQPTMGRPLITSTPIVVSGGATIPGFLPPPTLPTISQQGTIRIPFGFTVRMGAHGPHVRAPAPPPATARQNEPPPGLSRDFNDTAGLNRARNDTNSTPAQTNVNETSAHTNLPSNSAPKIGPGDDGWKENVPREWVSIIEEDMKKQASTEIQHPFSDAYLNGMPLKRRKVICDNKPNLNSDSESVLRQMIQNSAQETGAHSSNASQSPDELVTSLRLRPELVQSFEASLREKIRARTENDPDFDEKRFENVKKMLDSPK